MRFLKKSFLLLFTITLTACNFQGQIRAISTVEKTTSNYKIKPVAVNPWNNTLSPSLYVAGCIPEALNVTTP